MSASVVSAFTRTNDTMKRTLIATALLLAPMTNAEAATIAIGGHFNPGFATGWVDGVNDYNPAFLDDTGLTVGTPVDFSSPAIFPWPMTVSLDTPNFGEVVATLTTVDYLTYTGAGEFFQMQGTINGGGYAILDVNIPYLVTPSFGLFGSFAYDPPPPPPCTDCDPPPPCVACDPPSTVVGTPEPSTWAMMLMGFVGLGFAALRQRRMA